MGYAAGGSAAWAKVVPMPPTGATEKHLGNVPDNGPTKKEDIGCPETKPCLAAKEDLADRNFPPDYLHAAMITN